MKAALALFTAALTIAQNAGVRPAPRRDLPVQTGNASVAGAVLDSVTHTPIRKATVTLNGRSFLRVVTGDDGHFAFHQLPAGLYTIQAQAEKYPNPGQGAFDSGNQVSVSITGEEEKTDVSLSLTPGASLRGRIVDEEGDPMRCSVTATRLRNTNNGKTLADAGFGQSDEKGEYHLENLVAGKYYVVARCFASVPMPHAFIRRDAMAVVPTLTYPALFYPASASLSGATRVTLSAGTDLTGIDFHMAPATGVPVRGRVQPIVTGANLQVSLRPKDPLLRRFQQQGARLNQQTGEFQIPSVPPGSYDLIAMTRGDRAFTAAVPVEVGATAPEPIDLHLVPEAQITGSIAIDGDANISLKNLQILLNPVDEPINAPPPQAGVQSDGTFTTSAPPGNWRLRINGAPGYMKSMTVGDQEISGATFEVGSAPVSLKVVIGTKTAQIDATVAGLPTNASPVFVIIWSPDNEFQQGLPAPPQGPPSFHLPPGKYFACAMQVAQPFVVLQDRSLKNALAKRCSTIEVSESAHTSMQIPFIPTDDVKRLADSLDSDDSPGF